jgi:hypothetical protein
MKLWSYLFPPITIKSQLPLLPREWSSAHSRVQSRVTQQGDIQILKGFGVARTDADALRLLKRHHDKHVLDIAMLAQRKRKRKPRIIRAWDRLKRLW